ncbi:unnamed protein product, partial [marine sediment metagenome]
GKVYPTTGFMGWDTPLGRLDDCLFDEECGICRECSEFTKKCLIQEDVDDSDCPPFAPHCIDSDIITGFKGGCAQCYSDDDCKEFPLGSCVRGVCSCKNEENEGDKDLCPTHAPYCRESSAREIYKCVECNNNDDHCPSARPYCIEMKGYGLSTYACVECDGDHN